MASPSVQQQDDRPIDYCDLVMKGGITSGVVYPLAITKLSKKFLFKNIGGTSAGAVAAVITAAAEYGRRNSNQNAYDNLAALPKELGTDNLLLRLFQPSSAAVRAFRVVLAAMKAQSISGRILYGIGALVHQFWGWTILGVLLGGAIPLALFLIIGGPILAYALLGAFWILVIGGAVVLVAASVDAIKVTTHNGFGFCSGFDPNSESGPPLTNWLHERIQTTSGKNANGPLTFGDLWTAPLFPGEAPVTEQTIKLQVVTTNLSLGRPFTIPFESYAFYFREDEFRSLFPASIVQYMIDNAPAKKRNETVVSRDGVPLHRLPDAMHLPLLVAARMSLSFPILLSAIPLYLPDYAHKEDEPEGEDITPQPTRVSADLCWFSDGGICSNFPMHFFDSPLPRWPTFGIDLQQDPCEQPKSNDQMVWFPPLAGSGSQLLLENFDQGSNQARLFGFFGAIISTMQNWRDKLQATAAGYRDRIVHIKLCPAEGGLNLNMPPEVISNLSERGKIAGEMVIAHFKLSSHIFTRYRITMCALQKFLNDLSNSWEHPVPPQDQEGREYVSGTKNPPHYKPSSSHLRELIFSALQDLIKLSAWWQSQLKSQQGFCKDGAPRPEPILRNQPKF
jgi:predicted acylesterase/phospholipase RssA